MRWTLLCEDSEMKRIASLALAMGLMVGCEKAPTTSGPAVDQAAAKSAQEALDKAEAKAGEAAEAAGDAAKAAAPASLP